MLINNDTGSAASFNSGTNWSDGLAPSAGKTYLSSQYKLNSPTSSAAVFSGDSLSITGSGVLVLKNDVTINQLKMSNYGTIQYSGTGIASRSIGGSYIYSHKLGKIKPGEFA